MKNKCKVIGCTNSEMQIRKKARHENMKNSPYGYCQIHLITGLVNAK